MVICATSDSDNNINILNVNGSKVPLPPLAETNFIMTFQGLQHLLSYFQLKAHDTFLISPFFLTHALKTLKLTVMKSVALLTAATQSRTATAVPLFNGLEKVLE